MLEKNSCRVLSRAATRAAIERGRSKRIAKSLADPRFMTRKETPRVIYTRKGRDAMKCFNEVKGYE
jgi:predicted transcriptional regulator